MDESHHQTAPVDTAAYAARLKQDNQAGRCFICEIVEGNAQPGETIVYRDDVCVVFLPNFSRLHGYLLLAPVKHLTRVVEDFPEEQYLELQRRVHRLGRALSSTVPTDRLYVFSFGSNQGISHVHWHVASLPPGVPLEEQQFAAVDRPEYLVLSDHEKTTLAKRVAHAMSA